MIAAKRSVGRMLQGILPERLWITLQSRRSRNHQRRHLAKQGFLGLGMQFVDAYGTQVRHGPFAGMKYPRESVVDRHIVPRLLGSYELELHPILEGLASDYRCAIDIGSAEGYYAIGLARKLGVPVFAFETVRRERGLTMAMAKLNNVGELVQTSSYCTRSDLVRLCGERALVLSDCEGYECALFDVGVVSRLRDSDLLIETHGEGTEHLLAARLSATHQVNSISSRERSPTAFPEVQFMGDRAAMAVSDERSPQTWLWCESLSALGSRLGSKTAVDCAGACRNTLF